MNKDTFYITTPIYYPSGNWHIGTCYTTVVCDAMARFYRMAGKDVFFLTGTDEHGQKIENKAKEKGVTPKQFIDPIVDDLKSIWKMLDVSYDRFIRTTDADHVAAVQKIFKKLYEQGDIYKSEYEGHYCTDCESFFTESQLKDGKCPDCGREVHLEKEESYFFRLSKYADKILKLYEDNPEFLQPKSRVNEMVNNFIKPGLQDLCVSRTSIKWGIPVEFDKAHVVYVWIDALSNYISALGYGSDDDSLYKKFWPANLHMTGKEIIRFHAIIWPAILMALGEPLPEKVYGHGWLLVGGDKLSKSKAGNVNTELTDPKEIVARYGSDALRYFLLREIPFGSDGVYTNEGFLNRINSDLSNDLGNLVSRSTAMINQYFGGKLPYYTELTDLDNELVGMINSLYAAVETAIKEINVPKALAEIFKVVDRANKYIDETMPWVLGKDPTQKDRLATVMYVLAEVIRNAAIMLTPFIPRSAQKIKECFPAYDWTGDFADVKFGGFVADTEVIKAAPIFPRIDVKKELAEVTAMMTERHKAAEKANAAASKNEPAKEEPKFEQIVIDEFMKVELRVALVTACEKVEKSRKLLKLSIDLGYEQRTVVSGIADYYKPEELVGKKVCLVANLKPAKLCGIESQGMILCSDDGEKVSLVAPDPNAKVGARIR